MANLSRAASPSPGCPDGRRQHGLLAGDTTGEKAAMSAGGLEGVPASLEPGPGRTQHRLPRVRVGRQWGVGPAGRGAARWSVRRRGLCWSRVPATRVLGVFSMI